MYVPNFNFLAQFEGETGEKQHFFEVKKVKESPYLPPPPIDLSGWFLDMLYNFWFFVNWLKKGKILRFWPLSTRSPNWGITEFGPQFIPTDIYLIRRQTELIDRIRPILVSTKQSTWI